jgi:gluconate 5-dehydrogenase
VVVNYASSKEGAEKVVAEITKAGGKAIAVGGSVAKTAEIDGLFAAAKKAYGKVDILVNNAGATWGAPAEDHPIEAWDKLVNVNLTAAFLLSQQIAKRSMIPARWGRIINTASVAGLAASDPRVVRTVAYNATKHGLVGLTRQLAAEWGEHGITVNAICPGFFPSKMTRATLDTAGKMVMEVTPTGRLGNDEDLKGLAVLLASEASRHITGQAIAVDGGATII